VDKLALEVVTTIGQANGVTPAARALPLILVAVLMPCGTAVAASHAKPKPKPKPAVGHVGIGNAWGPVVVRPTHVAGH
jgi:hypothetical protein